MDTLKNYINNMITAFFEEPAKNRTGPAAYYRFLLEQGQQFAPAKLPLDIQVGQKKECYANAARLVSSNPSRFVYCEGLAIASTPIPISHAWVYDLYSKSIIDNTWRDDGREYYGVPIRFSFLNKHLLDHKVFGDVLSSALQDEQYPPWAWVCNINNQSQPKTTEL